MTNIIQFYKNIYIYDRIGFSEILIFLYNSFYEEYVGV